jgi:hypothetical protein
MGRQSACTGARPARPARSRCRTANGGGHVPVAQCGATHLGERQEGVVEHRRQLDEVAVGVDDRVVEGSSARRCNGRHSLIPPSSAHGRPAPHPVFFGRPVTLLGRI